MRRVIALTFIRPHVAAGLVFPVGTRQTALVGLQQIAVVVRAPTRVACINGRAIRQCHGHGRSAIIPQRAELRIGVVEITGLVKAAGVIAAQVIAV